MSETAPNPQTRRAVLELLKRRGPLTVAALAQALGVSAVAVRRHLEALEQEGLVTQGTRPSGRGRPAYLYALTERGHELFPRNYQQLSLQLLQAVEEELGPQVIERLFGHREAALARLYEGRTRGRSLPEVARALAEIQDENGYMASCHALSDGEYLVQEHNCAIARVAGAYPTACAHELALFRRLAGPDVAVERVQHMQAGDPVCAYRLRHAEPQPAAPGGRRPAPER